jgi:hypothetical protein
VASSVVSSITSRWTVAELKVLRNSIRAWMSSGSLPSKPSMTSVYSLGADKRGSSCALATAAPDHRHAHAAAAQNEAAARDERGPRCSANAIGRGRDNTSSTALKISTMESTDRCEPTDQA